MSISVRSSIRRLSVLKVNHTKNDSTCIFVIRKLGHNNNLCSFNCAKKPNIHIHNASSNGYFCLICIIYIRSLYISICILWKEYVVYIATMKHCRVRKCNQYHLRQRKYLVSSCVTISHMHKVLIIRYNKDFSIP